MNEETLIQLPSDIVGRRVRISTRSKSLFFAGVVKDVKDGFLWLNDRKGSLTFIALADVATCEALPYIPDVEGDA